LGVRFYTPLSFIRRGVGGEVLYSPLLYKERGWG
jgi:hypothetical protein